MERFSDSDWELLSRYLDGQVTEEELAQVSLLLTCHPALCNTLKAFHLNTNEPSFDSMPAFRKLEGRLNAEGLI